MSDAKSDLDGRRYRPIVLKRVDSFVKSDLDNRRYRHIVLPNELRVLLIQDETTDMASAAMNVNVGHFSDPEDVPGLAHFCEHMLFLGTKKYPSENEYSQYLSMHGGSSNAYTSMQDTNYHFGVAHAHLYGALDRFAQFFVAPLFTPSCTERELNAVNSENLKNLQNDSWRLYQLQKSTSNPDHPYHKFATGNLETLSTIPKENGIDVRERLLEFHRKFYSANVMGLAVLGRESLDELEKWISELFSDIPNHGISPPAFEGHAITSSHLMKRTVVVPVTDLHSLLIVWPLPDLLKNYKSMPERYISHLVGHEGPGSILSLLKKKGYATGLSAGASKSRGSPVGFDLFEVSIDLTEDGIQQDAQNEVVEIVCAYMKLLRSEPIHEWIFNECKELGDIGFQYKEKSRPTSATVSLATNILNVNAEDVLRYHHVFLEYRPDLIENLVQSMTSDNFTLRVVGRVYETRADLTTERWYGTRYAIEDFDQDLLTRIKEPRQFFELHLPHRNEFIPKNFELFAKQGTELNVSNVPTAIYTSKCAKLWYKLDQSFQVPKANVYLLIRSPLSHASPWTAVQMSIFKELFVDELNEFTYDAVIAHLAYSINEEPEGLQIKIDGFNDKLPKLSLRIAQNLAAMKPTQQKFNIMKEMVERELRNSLYSSAQDQVMNDTNEVLQEDYFNVIQRLEAIQDTTYERFVEFIKLTLIHLHFDFLIHGNITSKAAIELVQSFEVAIGPKPIHADHNRTPRSLKLPRGRCFVVEKSIFDPEDQNSGIELFYYICREEQLRSRCLLSLLSQIVSEPIFDQLRTKEQLGYVVFAGTRVIFGARGYHVLIQSEQSPAYLLQRVLAFHEQFLTLLETLSSDDFNKYAQALIVKKREKDKTLKQETGRYWNEILNGYLDFNRVETEVAMIETFTKDDVISFFRLHVLDVTSSALLLSARIAQSAKNDLKTPWATDEITLVTDLIDLRASLEINPVVTPATHPIRDKMRNL